MMKFYTSEKMFADPGFPLAAKLTPQIPFVGPHSHDFIELVLVRRGHTLHTVSTPGLSTRYGLIHGDLFTIMPGVVHAYAHSSNLLLYNLAFRLEVAGGDLAELRELPVCRTLFDTGTPVSRIHLRPFEYDRLERQLERLIQALGTGGGTRRLRARVCFLEFFLELDAIRAHQGGELGKSNNFQILESIRQMERNWTMPFDLTRYAQLAGMSVSSFTRKFRELTGTSPLEYFLELRISAISRQLLETDRTVTEIALAAGFCDASSMIRYFKRGYGCTPRQFRTAALSGGGVFDR